MVKTRSTRNKVPGSSPQPMEESTEDKVQEKSDYTAEELASLAFDHIKDKIKDKLDHSLPDILILPGGKEGDKRGLDLASRIDPGIDIGGERERGEKDRVLKKDKVSLEMTKRQEEIMKKSVITSDFEKKESAPPVLVSRYKLKKMRKVEREKSAGSNWFDMPAPEMTEELKNDLKVLQMRETLDRSHHYKKSDWKKLPKYFQVGRVIEGPGEFYSARIPKKQRKRTIVEELLADQDFKKYQKRKFSELQAKKQALLRRRKKKSFTKT
ncbi:PREDICTED: deoxynucleotidyltransferase terminal-interacting protein 2-like [Amphimedon queenslandica]|uniref:Fcf2 pre-rRNA processing C-terminal domain-containing protein n=1 Tax=Amphimedon queenslandica TaxID=400682 RepID=A0A1X7VC03_AMPQE|nr:PREDICTED: deoxynucleotidyltransferase terminal-interacting protein 2-like [Amphimedon queenslandica]|eukprot:XP_011402671.2 PREDICTED: deoxynucleotidyltransferase terminal-interacting protein 2-like [Amphimedon queenslandica]